MDDAGSERAEDESARFDPSGPVWLLLHSRSVEALLDVVVGLARGAIAGVDDASVSVARDGGFATAAGTSGDVFDADRVQYDSGHGPCVHATRRGQTVNVELAGTASRWPEFAEAAVAAGYRNLLSTPLLPTDRSLGALNLYSRRSQPFGEAEERVARIFADQAAVVLADAAALGEVHSLATGDTFHGQLSAALVTRDTVGWATGILMAGRRCSPDEAFDILCRTSKHAGRSLRDVAADLVAAAQTRQVRDR